jgi:hypothetical protein
MFLVRGRGWLWTRHLRDALWAPAGGCFWEALFTRLRGAEVGEWRLYDGELDVQRRTRTSDTRLSTSSKALRTGWMAPLGG